MKLYETMIVACSILFSTPSFGWAQSIVAAVLPSSRSVQVRGDVTALATIINTGQNLAIDCTISPLSSIPASFGYIDYESWDYGPTNIPARAAHGFLFWFRPAAPIDPTEVLLRFKCANTDPAPIIPGVNTLLLSASATATPDIVALVATEGNTGIVPVEPNGTGVFAVATVNVGASGQIAVSADTGRATLPLSIAVCETDPTIGICFQAPTSSVTTLINSGQTPTFGIFVAGTGTAIPFDPASNRVFVRFKDGGGVTRGSTSVAIGASDPCLGCWDY